MADNKKQHVIPQFYLRGFSGDGKRLYQFSAKTGEKHGVSIKDICTRNYFYDLPEDRNHVFEKYLSGIEDEQNRFLKTLIADVRNGQCDLRKYTTRYALILFVLFMNTRGFSVRKTVVNAVTDFLNQYLKIYMHTESFQSKLKDEFGSILPFDPETVTARLTKEGEVLWHLPLFEGLESVAEYLCKNDFFKLIHIVRDKPVLWKNSFFTSDEPVYFESLEKQSLFGTGLLSPGVLYILPLSNDVLAVIGDKKYANQMGINNEYDISHLYTSNEYETNEIIKQCNSIIIHSSHDLVFSFDCNMVLPRLLHKNAVKTQMEDNKKDTTWKQ